MHCNDYQLTLYHQLMDLVQSNAGGRTSFVCKDHELRTDPGADEASASSVEASSSAAVKVEHYRIFSYRWNPKYDDWCRPGALECRGIMYQMVDGRPHRLAAHPMEKFFNWHENPFTQSMDLSSSSLSSKVDCIEDKVDGSLISTFLTSATTAPDASRPQLKLKSKASLSSPQVVEATRWLEEAPQRALCQELERMTAMDRTVNLEWVSPSNRIVVRYSQPELRVLNIRSNADGSYLDKEDLPGWATQLSKRWTGRFAIPNCDGNADDQDLVSMLKSTSTSNGRQETEGFVIRLKDSGMRIKVKTDWYLQQVQSSKNKSSSSSSSLSMLSLSPPALLRAVLDETTDDLKSRIAMQTTNNNQNEADAGVDASRVAAVLQRIATMEDLVRTACVGLETELESFYEAHRHETVKEYALAARSALRSDRIGLAVRRFRGESVSYPKYLGKSKPSQEAILQKFEACMRSLEPNQTSGE